MQLFQKYAPDRLSRVAGHEQQKKLVERLEETGAVGGRAVFLTGLSGIGKSTFATLIARVIADPGNVLELDATGLTPAQVADIEKDLRSYAIGDKHGRAVVINEAHGLRKDTIRKLLVVLERIPRHVVWIFTTTTEGATLFEAGIDASPLLSRCLPLELRPDREAFAKRAKLITEHAGLGEAPLEAFIELAKQCNDNLRMMLTRIEAGAMLN